MKRKIFALVTILLCFSVGAAAKDIALKDNNRNISIISIDSKTAEGTKLTISIFSDDNSYENLTLIGNEAELLPFLAVENADANGKLEIEWENKKSGDYTIYVAGPRGVVEGYPKKLFVTSKMEDKFTALNSKNRENLEELFSDKIVIREFTGKSNDCIKDSKKSGIALFNIGKSIAETESIEDYINLAVMMNVLSDNPSKDNLKAVTDELKLKGLDFANSALYEAADDEIRNDMAKAFLSGYELDLSEWQTALNENIILSGVYKSATYLDCMDYLDTLNNSKYEANKTLVANAVVGKKYETVAELEAAINNVIIPAPPIVGSITAGGGGGGGSNRPASSGGVTASSSSSIVVSTPVNNYDTSVFTDIDNNHWAFEAVNYLHWKEIILGDEKNNFNPENYITRAETVKLLCLAFDFQVQSGAGQSFEDVIKDSWYFDYVNTFKSESLIKGDLNNNFNPENNITREDLSVLIYRVMQKKGTELNSLDLVFSDKDSVSEYAVEAVSALSGNGIINGFSDGSFRPKANATRAETAALIHRILTAK